MTLAKGLAQTETSSAKDSVRIDWQPNYAEAMRRAEREHKQVVVLFQKPENLGAAAERLEQKLSGYPGALGKLDQLILVKVPTDQKIVVQGQPTCIFEHAAFGKLQGQEGFAVVDMATSDPKRLGQVIRTVPFEVATALSVDDVKNLLDLSTDELVAQSSLNWQTNYGEAMRVGEREQKMVLLLFSNPGRNDVRDQFVAKLHSDPRVLEKLGDFILAKLPMDGKVKLNDKQVNVLDHPAFAEMRRRQGFAIVDLAHQNTEHYGRVVNVFPFAPGKYYRFQPNHLSVILDLPAGTLTQRTMIYAVRVHPEGPASTKGIKDPVLTDEAGSHSRYQAQIRVQGHHRWDSRFQRIIGRLFGRKNRYRVVYANPTPVEVVAESWPDQDLVDSCVDCVHSWRQSPGHWNAVKSRHAGYGYDIRRGSNGIWYATGIFTN